MNNDNIWEVSQEWIDNEQQFIASLIAENQKLKQAIKNQNNPPAKSTIDRYDSDYYQKMLYKFSHALVVINQRGKLLFINQHAQQLFGRSAQDLDDYDFGIPVNGKDTEITLIKPQGKLLTVKMGMQEISWQNKKAYLAALKDISEYKYLEKNLLLIRRAVESSSEAILILNAKGKCLYHNPAFIELFAYNPEFLETINDFKKVFSEQDYEHYKNMINAIIHGESSQNYELTIGKKHYQKKQVSLHADGIYNNRNHLVGVVITAINITKRKQIEKELNKINYKLKASNKQLKNINQKIMMLGEIIEFLQACLSLNEAYQLLKIQIPKLFKECSGIIFRQNEESKLMEPLTVWGTENESKLIFAADECWALRQGHLHSVDHQFPFLCSHIIPNSEKINSSLCLPMISKGEILGLIYLCQRKKATFTADEQQFAATVTKQISLAVANLKLRERLQREFIRDPLTGLFNRRYLEESLQQELSRSQRNKQPIGVIMIDLDYFKRFNDDYGHEAGDIVLRVVGKFLKKSVRNSDIACRYGGEELTLILPEANLEQTKYRAEQIRQNIKKIIIEYQGQHLPQITASFGVAYYYQQTITMEQLLKNADTALYQAKANGRDCVVIFGTSSIENS